MARKSPFELRFLRRRRESEGFLYCRTIPKDVRAALSGQVHLSWSGRTIMIGSCATIKISLNTTNVETAVERWNEIKGPVDNIVREATKRTRPEQKHASASSLARVSGLSRDQIKTLGRVLING